MTTDTFHATVVGGSHPRKCIRVRVERNGGKEWIDLPVDNVAKYEIDAVVEVAVTVKSDLEAVELLKGARA